MSSLIESTYLSFPDATSFELYTGRPAPAPTISLRYQKGITYIGLADRFQYNLTGHKKYAPYLLIIDPHPPSNQDLLKEERILLSPILRAQLAFYVEKSVLKYIN
jgi:hypothetical protein